MYLADTLRFTSALVATPLLSGDVDAQLFRAYLAPPAATESVQADRPLPRALQHGGAFETVGNNAVRDNGTDTSGTMSVIAAK